MRALIGVADRNGLSEFVSSLKELGVEIVADDATQSYLAEQELEALPIASLPEASNAVRGTLALLQPAVIDRVLHCADRDGGFDIVVVNLPSLADGFSTVAEPSGRLALVDTGRPAVLRAAAVNYADVTVLSDPEDYEDVLAELFRYTATKEKTRRSLAAKAMSRLAAYDAFATALLEGE
ncbi:MAG TPA: hypothetical protein VFA78_07435, partial [Chloroflexota bacterium]|nr:hypothetical protein [Chloroflexota bacterium]